MFILANGKDHNLFVIRILFLCYILQFCLHLNLLFILNLHLC